LCGKFRSIIFKKGNKLVTIDLSEPGAKYLVVLPGAYFINSPILVTSLKFYLTKASSPCQMSIAITITKAGHYMSKILRRFLMPSSTNVRATTWKVHGEPVSTSAPFLDIAVGGWFRPKTWASPKWFFQESISASTTNKKAVLSPFSIEIEHLLRIFYQYKIFKMTILQKKSCPTAKICYIRCDWYNKQKPIKLQNCLFWIWYIK
jgi:hypothetical protein